ncbi:AAA family ATPase [Arenibacter palladensis]|uniref:AAA family ATPase n=1 Tax=Arenibacter palladensis TaxID=237373 RepID=UPI002FD1E858
MDKNKTNIGIHEVQNEVEDLIMDIARSRPKSLSEKLQDLEIKATEEILPPQSAWEQLQENGSAVLGTLGNFSLIIGKAKSRKSFFVNIAISAVLKNDMLLNQFTGCLPTDKRKVIYFDTEQGKYHVQLSLKRICAQIGSDIPKDLKVYGLRSKTPSERLELIEYAICNTPNLGFVVIDGIKDLVTSINDEAEATKIASKLLKWTEEQNIHIVTVLHQNKSDNNARGHIGTELINKAETVLSVTKKEQDKNISVVEAQQCRNKEPEPFAFEIDEDGLPTIVENYKIRSETRGDRFNFKDMEDFKKFQLLRDVFSNEESIRYSELVKQIKLAYNKQFKSNLGDNRSKELITYCKNQDWLKQEKRNAPYTLGRFNNNIEI